MWKRFAEQVNNVCCWSRLEKLQLQALYSLNQSCVTIAVCIVDHNDDPKVVSKQHKENSGMPVGQRPSWSASS